MAKHNFPPLSVAQVKKYETCNICKSSIEFELFRDHLIEHEMKNGIISCVICTSIFTSIVGLKDHIREHTLTPMDLKETCDKCNSRFLYPSELLHHQHEHEGNLKTIKLENNENGEKNNEIRTTIKEEEDDDYIEIEKVAENS